MIDDRALKDLAAEQHALVTSAQAADLGFSGGQRMRLSDGLRWERATPRVLRLVGSPPTDGQRAMLAVLDAGPGSALSGASAGAWWGIPGNLLKPWHVVRQRDQTNRPFVRKGQAHEPTLFDPDQIVELDGVPVVVPARALFDVAGTMRRGAEKPWWVERLARMVDNAWAMRLVSGQSLHAMLEVMAQRGRPGIRTMRQVLATRGLDYVPPASNLEARFEQILLQAGEAPMRRQVDIGDGDRWIGRVDFRDADLPLIVEIQSERFHASLIDKQLDATRMERLRAAGFVVLEFTDQQVWHQRHHVLDEVRRGRREAKQLQRAA
ncbi:MAG TPA: DUF559 domain-containing protein [Acidimicrobiales bacterium]